MELYNTTHSTIIDGGEQSNSASQSETNTSQSEVNTSQISEVNMSQPIAMTSATTNIKSKLPKLTLLKFKGDVTKWDMFWDSYESAIHKNYAITKVDKFNYYMAFQNSLF